MIYWLHEKRGARESLGEKGFLLAGAKKAGLPVPDGFVVPSEEVVQLYDQAVVKKLLRLNGRADGGLTREHIAAARRSLAHMLDQSFAETAKDALAELTRIVKHSPVFVAVRTSENNDPLMRRPTHRSVLPVESAPQVVAAIKTLLNYYLDEVTIVQHLARGDLTLHDLAPAILVQELVNAQIAGVACSIDAVVGDHETMMIEAALGLGGPVLAGELTPDRYKLAKGSLEMIEQVIAKQPWRLIQNNGSLIHERLDDAAARSAKLSHEDLLSLGRLIKQAEVFAKSPVEIEWVKANNEFYVVDVRLLSRSRRGVRGVNLANIALHTPAARIAIKGIAASVGAASGPVKIIHRVADIGLVVKGDVVVTEVTSPAYLPAFKQASAVITDTGGVNSHAAVAAREMGIPCIVAAGSATHTLKDGQMVTVDGGHGLVYAGALNEETVRSLGIDHHMTNVFTDERLITATKLYMNLTDPSVAAQVAQLPVDGVGLLRAEFMIASLGEHPQLLLQQGKRGHIVDMLIKKLHGVLAAFAPRPVMYRLSDFKTSEYRNLRGGEDYEPREENPAMGFRGARRLLDQPSLLAIELEVIRRCRDELGHRNIWLMIPFVRTPEELAQMRTHIESAGLYQSQDFKLYMMVEVPSNVLLIRDFLKLGIDGVSIGTNDLTSLILGVDREAGRLAASYPPTHKAVMTALIQVVEAAKEFGVASSICGSAASQYPEIIGPLIQAGITSVSVAPDAVVETRRLIASLERQLMLDAARTIS